VSYGRAVTGAHELEEDELLRWMRQPAPRWPHPVGWSLTALALVLNVANAPAVARTVGKLENLMGVLWTFTTHLALLLALCCVLIPRARRRPLNRRGAILWLLLALFSLLTFPISYAATELALLGGFNRLF
jgi:hypothetical protein